MSVNLLHYLRRLLWCHLIFLSVALIGPTPMPAQSVSGNLQVSVVEMGAPVPGATVTATRLETGQVVTQSTSDVGIATFNNLVPGRYTITVALPGFATYRQDVQIGVGQTLTLPVRLAITATVQTVVVSSEEERQELISALPNLNNDLTPLLQVVPGAVATGSPTLGKIVIDGKGKDQQSVRIDGVDATQLAELPSTDPTIDVLSSFQQSKFAIKTDASSPKSRAFPASVGPGTGTVLDTITYTGSETWRLQAYTENRNDALNARNFFDYEGKNALRLNRFGSKLSGPLKTGQAFAYFSYEGVRSRIERNFYEALPVPSANGGPIASVFNAYLPPGTQVIPNASLNPDFQIGRRRGRTSVDADSAGGRIDTKTSSTTMLTTRFTRQEARNLAPDGITARQQRQHILFTNGLVDFLVAKASSQHDFKLGYNDTRGSVNVETPANAGVDLSRSLITTGGTVGVSGLPGAPLSVPVATLGGLVKGVGRGFNLKPASTSISYNFDRGGKHQLSLGGETRFIKMDLDRLGGLTYAFPNVSALRTAAPGTVTLLSDLSAPSPFQNGVGPRQARQENYMGHLQMTSAVTSFLTLTYGLRYDYFGVVRERNDRAVVVDPKTGEILPSGASFYRPPKNNFEPRFGLAYVVSNSGFLRNTTFRAGAGVYSVAGRIGDLVLPIDSDRFSTGVNGGTFPMPQNDVIRSFLDNPENRQFQPLAFARDFNSAERAYKWEASFTKSLAGLYDFKLLYTGNTGRHLPIAGIANPIVSVQTNVDPTKSAVVLRQFDIIRGNQVFKPFGEFFSRSSDGRSSYNGFTVQLKRNGQSESLPRWLRLKDFNTQYTLARNVGNVSGAVVSNALDFNSDYGYNAADARHSFSLSAVYDLWDALGQPPNTISGWRFVPAITARSGLPLVVRLDRPDVVYTDASGNVFSSPAVGRQALLNTPGGGGSGGTRVPDLRSGVSPYLNKDLELLNPDAFAIPKPGTLGNIQRGQLRGPAFYQFDLGITRNVFKAEKTAGELRVDIFNIFNHANFNNPTAVLPNALGTSAAGNELQPGAPFTRAAAGGFGLLNASDISRQIQFSLILKLNGGFTN